MQSQYHPHCGWWRGWSPNSSDGSFHWEVWDRCPKKTLLVDTFLTRVYWIWQNLGGYRGEFCEKTPGAEPMLDRASSSQPQKRPTLATAELVCNMAKYSVGMYLRKGKNCSTATVREGWENPAVNKEGEDVLQVLKKRFPCRPWRKSWIQFVLLQPMEDATTEQVDVTWRKL